MRDILLVSPFIQKPGIQVEEVKEDDVHDRDTRLNEERKEALAAQQEQKRKKEEKDLLGRPSEKRTASIATARDKRPRCKSQF